MGRAFVRAQRRGRRECANTGCSLSARRTGQNDLFADVSLGAEICRSLKVLTALGVPVAGSGVRAAADSR